MKSPLRVLHIVPAIPFGGMQRLAADLAAAQRDLGLEATVCGLYNGADLQRLLAEQGVPSLIAGANWPRRFSGAYQLTRALQAYRPDIVHIHDGLLWSNALRPLFPRMPWVCHCHVDVAEPLSPVARLAWAMRDRLFDAAICVSHFVAASVRQHCPRLASRCHVAYNGIELSRWSETAPVRRRIHPFPTIGMACRLAERKGILEFVRIAASVARQLPGSRFRLAGQGPMREPAQALARDLGVTIEFVGHVQDMKAFWSSLDMALFTSEIESFGLTILETQAMGLPVVAFANGTGSDEVIVHDRTGVLVPWDDIEAAARAVVDLWGDPSRRTRFQAAAIERIRQQFTIERTARTCVNIYYELLGASLHDGPCER